MAQRSVPPPSPALGNVGVRSLADAWRSGVFKSPHQSALQVDGASISYRELDERARSIAAAISQADPTGAPVAVLGQRSLDAYLGVLGAVLAGRTYVPLHPGFPVDRTSGMLRRSGAATLVVGPEADDVARPLLESLEVELAVLFPTRRLPEWSATSGMGLRLDARDIATTPHVETPRVSDESIAYLLFTSGSTGMPKGVGVSQANVSAYLSHAVRAYGYSPADRCSQMFDLTFDLSVHDLFATWMAGACLCVPTKRATIAPAKFIRDEEITAWFSVPSAAMLMDRMRTMKPGAYPSLRISLFCGEALPATVAQKWSAAAPNSTVHNLYGPTEATIAITSYEWTANSGSETAVPIGRPFPGHEVVIVDPSGHAVSEGQRGELCLAGPQVTPGYWEDPERTAASFVTLPHSSDRWYRTGDLVEWSPTDGLIFHGRIDDQVQVMGFRVELAEVDAVLRAALHTESVITVSYPAGPAAEALYAFAVRNGDHDGDQGDDHNGEVTALAMCREVLPPYMVPKQVFFIDHLPLNSNGKIDRAALSKTLEGRAK